MENKKIIATFILFISCICPALSQSSQDIYSKYVDSLKIFKSRQQKELTKNVKGGIKPMTYKLIGPATYYNEATHSILRIDNDEAESYADSLVYSQLIELYTKNPSAIHFYKEQYTDEKILTPETNRAQDELTDVLTNQVPDIDDVAGISTDIDIALQVKRPNFWKRTGSFALQFTQNYFSENWYKGGNNNGTMLGTLLLQANYDDTKRVTWENRLEMRLGFITTTSDSCHTFLTNNDKLDLQSKLGIKTTKSWYYTVSAEAKTQFMPGYKSNNRNKFSDFLAPLDIYVSTGMDYKPSLKNGNSISIALLPLSFKWRYIGVGNENIHKVYNMNNIRTTEDYGSRIEFNCKFNICKNLAWKCRSYYFTSYKYAEAELENSFSFRFSRYISSEAYTLWRFDDNRGRDNYDRNIGYFQFKEYLTLGLKYDF